YSNSIRTNSATAMRRNGSEAGSQLSKLTVSPPRKAASKRSHSASTSRARASESAGGIVESLIRLPPDSKIYRCSFYLVNDPCDESRIQDTGRLRREQADDVGSTRKKRDQR